jgi:hypothetical protein
VAQQSGSVDVTGPSPAMLETVGDTWCVVAAGAGAGLCAAGKRVLSGVVPGPRGIVAGQSGVVSSFLMR